jgi:predicted DsbA family dithiol-disulfide isomerase
MTAAEAADAQRQMERRAEAVGLDFHMAGLRSGNTYDAHRLLQLAKARDLQPELVERLHRAYFVEQRSIFDADSLVALASDVGLDADEVRRVLANDDYAEEVAADIEAARAIGVTGVPFFVIDRKYALSGAQPAEVIERALAHAQAEAARSDA